MAYVRFGRDSDVYVYEAPGGKWECSGCSLTSHGLLVTDSRSQMIRHLRQHLGNGDKVQEEVIRELEEEIKQVGDAVASK